MELTRYHERYDGLLRELEIQSLGTSTLLLLRPQAAMDLAQKIISRFGDDTFALAPWESFHTLTSRSTPSNWHERFTEVGSSVDKLRPPIFFVMNNLTNPPWPIFSGAIVDLLHLYSISSCEEAYFLDATLRSIVVDTHHSEVMVFASSPT